jgi:hypothetical protein
MKYNTDDRYTPKHKNNAIKWSNYHTVYSQDVRICERGENGEDVYHYEPRDLFEIKDDGLLKCLKCYTLMIPFVNSEGTLLFFNLDGGDMHIKSRKETKLGLPKRWRKYDQYMCVLPKG